MLRPMRFSSRRFLLMVFLLERFAFTTGSRLFKVTPDLGDESGSFVSRGTRFEIQSLMRNSNSRYRRLASSLGAQPGSTGIPACLIPPAAILCLAQHQAGMPVLPRFIDSPLKGVVYGE
jgi:hypothetical protein